MITVQIGGSASRTIAEASESWITEQIQQRRRDGSPICVRVSVATSDLNVALASQDCPLGIGGGRPPNERERRILDLWVQRVNSKNELNPGELIAFLRQLDRLV